MLNNQSDNFLFRDIYLFKNTSVLVDVVLAICLYSSKDDFSVKLLSLDNNSCSIFLKTVAHVFEEFEYEKKYFTLPQPSHFPFHKLSFGHLEMFAEIA